MRRTGGGLSDMLAPVGVRKKCELKQFCDRKKNHVNFDFANVIIGVDMKIEKGLTKDVDIPFQHYL